MYYHIPGVIIMYNEAYFASIKRQTRLRVLLGTALMALFLAAVIVFTVKRMQIPQLITAGIGFIVVYFVWYFKVMPYTKYNRFMKELKSGRTRTGVFNYTDISSETRMYDGVEVWDLEMNEGPEEEDRRLFVFDADMEKPAFKEGDRVEITSFGRFVTEYKVLGN